jgi:tRNA (guanine-N7-)-methyltransferase
MARIDPLPITTKRRGRLSAAKRRALDELGPRYGVPGDGPLGARLDAALGRRARRLLDVGVGAGAATVAWALAHPDRDVVAVDVHRPGLALLLAALDGAGAANARVVDADVRALLADAEPGAVDDVRLLFPDPWPKRRHHGRRLVDAAFVARVGDVLPPGGTLHVATDWDAYADAVRAALAADGRFGPPVEGRPDRPATAFEAAGVAAGRAVTDLVATRN